MRIDIPGTKKLRQNSFCCPLISVNITPPWMGKTEELGKLPSIQSYSGRHFGFQNQKGGRRGFWDEDSLSSNGYFQTQDPPGFPYLVVGTITNALGHLAPRTYNYKEELALT